MKAMTLGEWGLRECMHWYCAQMFGEADEGACMVLLRRQSGVVRELAGDLEERVAAALAANACAAACGDATLHVPAYLAGDSVVLMGVCVTCDGTGGTLEAWCSPCDGAGVVPLTVPDGTADLPASMRAGW